LARWDKVQNSSLRPLAEMVDRTLFAPWAAAAKALRHRKLTHTLGDVDVFHSSDVLLWKQATALNVITIHDLTALLLPGCHTANTREMQAHVYKFAQKHADRVIAVSEATKGDIVTHLGIPSERVRVVHNGVTSAFHPIQDTKVARALAPLGLVPDSYILHVGTIEPRKNLVRLVEAYSQVRKAILLSTPKLVLVGAKGWQFQGVFKRIEALNLENDVIFLDKVPTNLLPALYNGATLFVYPSLYEGFGLPPLEAMACGAPVIASNTSSLPEIVGDAGMLIDPIDVQALTVALVTLLKDAELCADMSARGMVQAGKFSWERAARETLHIYQNGAREKPKTSAPRHLENKGK
jgi:glycosyltransferase involved in cell wall biosynthesis